VSCEPHGGNGSIKVIPPDLPSAQIVHILGVGALFAFLCAKGKRGAKVWQVISSGLVIAAVGAAFNLFLSNGSLIDQMTFRETNYGSFFIVIGYGLILYSPVALGSQAHGKKEQHDT
jgi:hypothetical protein